MKHSEITTEIIVEELCNINDDDVIYLWNNYCEGTNDLDASVYPIEAIDDYMHGKTPTEILDSVTSNFSTNDNYFSIDGYGYFYSFNSITSCKSPLYLEELADWIIDNQLDDFIENYTDIELDDDDEEDDSNYQLYVW